MEEHQKDKKPSVLLENKETISSSGIEVGTEVDTDGSSHAVLTAIPTAVESLGSSNHIHVQLFEGPVIQITSASLVDTDSKNDNGTRRKICEGEKRGGRSCVVGGELSAGGAVTLLTSDGKTYILPQPIASGGGSGAGYLIAEEVLSAEEVLQSTNVLHEEQMLTISPPPPSALDFPPSDARTPDALAIATSEVFNEDYISLPLETQSRMTGSRAFQFKAEEGKGSQNPHPQLKNGQQEETIPLAGSNTFITLPSSCPGEVSGWPGKGIKEFIVESDLTKRGEAATDNPTYTEGGEVTDPLNVSDIEGIEHMAGNSVKQLEHMDSVSYSSVFNKWCGTHNGTREFTGDFPANSSMCRKMGVQEALQKPNTKVETANQVGTEDNLKSVSLEKKHTVNKTCEEDSENVSSPSDPATLRRSSRIRRTRKVPSETPFPVLDDAGSQKRRRGVRGETRAALWECGSCDAMFRTKAGRDRHLEEGHAFTCYVCGWRGSSKTKYEVHISTVHCHHQARCLACRKDFESYEQYRQHIRTAHPASSTPVVKMEVESEAGTLEKHGGEEVEEEGERMERDLVAQEQSRSGNKEKADPDDPDVNDTKAGLARVEADADVSEEEACQSYRAEQGCPYCGKTFHRRSRFIRHLNYHLGNRSFLCKICNKSFVEKSGLDAHLLTHQPLNAPCGECGKIFKTPRTMKRHMRTHLDRTFPCEVCSKVFRHEESLRVHKAVHRKGGSGNMCEVCEKDCKTPYYLQLHLSTKHEAAKFTCLRCQRTFKWKQSYRKHMAIYHGDAQLKYKCGICTRHFLTTSELRLHQVVHSSERKHLCDVCGKAFKHEYTRDKHVKTVHRDDREHMCPQCGSLFKAKAYLDQHLAHVHTTRERVKCKHCGHDFKTEANLRSHIKIVHKAKNRKYPCESCSKTFLAPKDLARHYKVHTGEKDYSCPTCHRYFSRKDNMAAHLRTHTMDQQCLSYNPKAELPGVTQILGLPSSAASDMPNSNNIILPSLPPTASNIIHTAPSSSNNIVISNMPSDNISLAGVSLNSDSTSLSSTSAPTGGLPSLPATSNGIILSTVPISSLGVTGIPVSSSGQAAQLSFSTTHSISTSAPLCYAHPGHNSLSQSGTSSDGPVTSTSPTSSQNMMVTISRTPQQNTYNLHPHLVPTSLPAVVPSLPSSSSPLPSTILSLPPHPVSSSPVIMSQTNRTQMVCSSFQSDQVVLTAGVLSAASTAPLQQTPTSSHYTQLDPMGATISSSANINSFGTSVPSCATLGPGIPPRPRPSVLPGEESHHGATEGGVPPGTVEAGIILPTSSLLQDTALIIPEKSGVYTLVSDGGKMTPLETLALHPIPVCHPAGPISQPTPTTCHPPPQATHMQSDCQE